MIRFIDTTNNETTAYQWDCFDRLTKVTLPAKGGATSGETVEFEYDSSGMLIGEKSGGMERKFTQQNRFATRETIKNGQDEWETSAMHVIHGTMLASYIGATSQRFGGKKQISHDTKTIFYHTDHLGSVRLITDDNGNIVNSSSTDAYGNPLPHADSSGNKPAKILQNFNFIGTHGIRYVEKVKLHNMRARWYGKSILRFNSMDQIKGDNRTPFINRYIYTTDNPVVFIDSSGLKYENVRVSPKKYKKNVCKALNDLENICPKLKRNFFKVSYEIMNLRDNWNAGYKDNIVYINIGYFYHNLEYRVMAYLIMEELIHYEQDKLLRELSWLEILDTLEFSPQVAFGQSSDSTFFDPYSPYVIGNESNLPFNKRKMKASNAWMEGMAKMARYVAAIMFKGDKNFKKNIEVLQLMHPYLFGLYKTEIAGDNLDVIDPYAFTVWAINNMHYIQILFPNLKIPSIIHRSMKNIYNSRQSYSEYCSI